MEERIDTLNRIRGFNRFYTNILGLLDRHLLNSDYSLTEARILFEINETGCCTANALSTKLNIDKSYLSRIIARFEKRGLILKEVSCNDSRVNDIRLSEKGLDSIHALIEKSNSQIEQFLSALNNAECNEILAAMNTIKKHFTTATSSISIRPFINADIDFVISRQIQLYATEYGFTSEEWKTYVADGVNHLVKQFDVEKDCMYILEHNGAASGCIAITHVEDTIAQLRFFFIEADIRGLGAGNRLIDMAIDFCREKKYRHVFLWTFSKLEAARHLYAKKGFKITDTHQNIEWGEPVLEERWDLDL